MVLILKQQIWPLDMNYWNPLHPMAISNSSLMPAALPTPFHQGLSLMESPSIPHSHCLLPGIRQPGLYSTSCHFLSVTIYHDCASLPCKIMQWSFNNWKHWLTLLYAQIILCWSIKHWQERQTIHTTCLLVERRGGSLLSLQSLAFPILHSFEKTFLFWNHWPNLPPIQNPTCKKLGSYCNFSKKLVYRLWCPPRPYPTNVVENLVSYLRI